MELVYLPTLANIYHENITPMAWYTSSMDPIGKMDSFHLPTGRGVHGLFRVHLQLRCRRLVCFVLFSESFQVLQTNSRVLLLHGLAPRPMAIQFKGKLATSHCLTLLSHLPNFKAANGHSNPKNFP